MGKGIVAIKTKPAAKTSHTLPTTVNRLFVFILHSFLDLRPSHSSTVFDLSTDLGFLLRLSHGMPWDPNLIYSTKYDKKGK